MNRNLLFGAAAAVIGLGIIAVFLLRGDGADDAADSRGLRQWLAGEGPGSVGFAGDRELEKAAGRGPTPDVLLKLHRRYWRYPANSRPLRRGMVDLRNPWHVKSVPLPVITDPALASESGVRAFVARLRAEGKTDEQIEAQLRELTKSAPIFLFQPNRHTITLQDRLEAPLELRSPGGAPLRYTVSSAELLSDPVFARRGLGSVQYNDQGSDGDRTAGDGVFTFSWQAPSADKKYWGSLTLRARLRVPGISGEVTVEQGFFSSPIAPARFTGQFRESLEDGSLVIEADLEVNQDCRFQLQANLYSVETNEPTHFAQEIQVLSKGSHAIKFLFFGKIFRDGAHEGKFRLSDLRGTCENMPFPAAWLGDPARLKQIESAAPLQEPAMLYLPYTDVTYTTARSYSQNDFSDREHDSPKKQEDLKRLEALAKQ